MSKGKASYHHGDLRSALIAEGLRILEMRAAEELGLREVARAAGVSATAVYRHFPDKEALLRALASEGFQRLGDAQATASQLAGGGVAGFNASGVAYVRFALANRGLFRLMFSHAPESDGNAPSSKDAAAVRAMRMLQENAAALTNKTVGEPAARLVALRAWSLVHGLALLILDGQAEADDQTLTELIDVRCLMPHSPDRNIA